MKNFSILIAAFVLSGCAYFADPIAEVVADKVDDYCQEPKDWR